MSATTSTASTAPRCGDCGEDFAGPVTATGTTPIITGALHAGAGAAGWVQKDGTWTCTVCLAGIAGPLYGPERELAPPLPAPDTDPYRQYADMSAELDQDLARFWKHENQEHNAARFRIGMRLDDTQVRISELTGVLS